MIHRDIKPENILIADQAQMHVKLCDFGWSTHTIDERRMTFCGTVDYVAPELIGKQPYDDKIDVWAVGILTYELLVGSAPFTGNSENQTYRNIVNLDLHCNERYRALTATAKDFISRILQAKPEDRPDLATIMKHEWLQAAPAPHPDL